MSANEAGKIGEDIAVKYLTENGYRVIARNFKTRYAEIDIIAEKGDFIVFVEVKYRKSVRYGEGEEAVNRKKLRKIMLAGEFFLTNFYKKRKNPRIDVISILSDNGIKIKHYENVFF